jgi:hypothetical protein
MQSKIIREISIIRRYSRYNENEDARFRVFIKNSLNLSNAQLDDIVQETTDRIWKQINCLDCGNCCKTLRIILDTDDIKRLASHLKMSVRAFEKEYIGQDKEYGDLFFKQSPPCPFLGKDNACKVYEHRPKACRDFPYLHEKNFRSRSISMVENLETCPIVFNVWQSLKTQLKHK